jgi:hypothetical protein
MIKNPSGLVIRYISHRKVDAAAVAKWKVPTGMTCHLHEFYAREGGSIRNLAHVQRADRNRQDDRQAHDRLLREVRLCAG